MRPEVSPHRSIACVYETRSVDHPSPRFPTAINAPNRQTTRLEVKDDVVSAHRAQSPMHRGEQAPRPLLCLSRAERSPVQDDLMEQAFREHTDLTNSHLLRRVS